MKSNHLPFHLGLGLAIWSSLLLPGTAPQAKAQNLSDITGPIMTTSDSVGFGTRNRQRIFVFRTAQIQAAVNQAAISLNAQLQAGNFAIARGGSNISISANVQQALFIVLTGTGDVQASVNQLVSGLINPPLTKAEQKAQVDNPSLGSDRAALAQKLVSTLTGLTANGKVDAAKFRTLVAAYNAFINASSGEYLTNPPEEFLAIQLVISTLFNAAQTA